MSPSQTNGSANGSASRPHNQSSPYQSVQDFLSNINNFKIIESTLREGEQFANAFFDTGMAPFLLPCANLYECALTVSRDQGQDVRHILLSEGHYSFAPDKKK